MSASEVVIEFKIDEQPFSMRLMDDKSLGLTPREQGRIKRICGAAGIDILHGLNRVDMEVIAAIAVVAAARTGVAIDEDKLLDGVASFDFEVENTASGPPPVAVAADGNTSPTTHQTLVTTGSPS